MLLAATLTMLFFVNSKLQGFYGRSLLTFFSSLLIWYILQQSQSPVERSKFLKNLIILT